MTRNSVSKQPAKRDIYSLTTAYRWSLVAAAIMLVPANLAAQESETGPTSDYLERLESCQQIALDSERLACFDAAVGNIVTASEAGEVQVIDQETARATRRSLFGLSLPDLGIFGEDDDDDDDELFSTTIVSYRQFDRSGIRFTTAENAVWQMRNVPRRLRIKEGDEVEFKKASFGTYYIRINGQLGVKGKRVR